MEQAALAQLRELLLKEEQDEIADLRRRLESDHDLRENLSRHLPEAISRSADTDPRLAAALKKPVREGVAQAVREDVEGFAEVLFPVMGPGIRRAIAEALKDFRRSLDYGMGRAVLWRVEAIRRGVPFAEVLLERGMPYRVELALLIHPDTGLVISRAENEAVVAQDSDAFSAMLTAIQDFIRDSFDGDSQISTLELGNRTVWITAGAKAHLACVISGTPGPELRSRLADVVDRLHVKYRDRLSRFSGDRSDLDPVDLEVERCLRPDEREREELLNRTRMPWVLLGLLLIVLLVWLVWFRAGPAPEPAHVRASRALEDIPGIAITRVEAGEPATLHALVDPLAEEPAALLGAAGIDAGSLTLRTRPYLSLEPELVLRRARHRLAPPEGVELELDGQRLLLSGQADVNWIRGISAITAGLPGVDSVDLGGLRPLHDLGALRRELAAPDSVTLAMAADGLRLSGAAPWNWLQSLPERLRALRDVPVSPHQSLQPVEWLQAQELAESLARQPVFFERGTLARAESLAHLDAWRQTLKDIRALRAASGFSARLQLIGHTDGVGTAAENLRLREARIDAVLKALFEGEPWPAISRDPQPQYQASPGENPEQRRVEITLRLDSPERWLHP